MIMMIINQKHYQLFGKKKVAIIWVFTAILNDRNLSNRGKSECVSQFKNGKWSITAKAYVTIRSPFSRMGLFLNEGAGRSLRNPTRTPEVPADIYLPPQRAFGLPVPIRTSWKQKYLSVKDPLMKTAFWWTTLIVLPIFAAPVMLSRGCVGL